MFILCCSFVCRAVRIHSTSKKEALVNNTPILVQSLHSQNCYAVFISLTFCVYFHVNLLQKWGIAFQIKASDILSNPRPFPCIAFCSLFRHCNAWLLLIIITPICACTRIKPHDMFFIRFSKDKSILQTKTLFYVVKNYFVIAVNTVIVIRFMLFLH